MKTVQISAYGGMEVLKLNENVPKPALEAGKVLVEIHAAAINPFDSKVRAGYMKAAMPLQFPVTPGGDFSGVVKKVSSEVTDLKAGDEVYGTVSVFSGGSGSLAEFAVGKPSTMALKPKSINFTEAAAVVLVGVSAIQALEEHMKLQPGQKILIHGGAGGIGSMAIQLAKSIGAYVATTASAKDTDFVKKLGADEVIDYKSEAFEQKLQDYNAVYDTVGGETTAKSFEVLKKGGVIVSMMGQPDEKLAAEHGVKAIGQGTKTNTAHLNRLRELIENGALKPQIDSVFPLEETQKAFQKLEAGSPNGKVVVHIL